MGLTSLKGLLPRLDVVFMGGEDSARPRPCPVNHTKHNILGYRVKVDRVLDSSIILCFLTSPLSSWFTRASSLEQNNLSFSFNHLVRFILRFEETISLVESTHRIFGSRRIQFQNQNNFRLGTELSDFKVIMAYFVFDMVVTHRVTGSLFLTWLLVLSLCVTHNVDYTFKFNFSLCSVARSSIKHAGPVWRRRPSSGSIGPPLSRRLRPCSVSIS